MEKANLRTGTPVPEAAEKLLAPIKKRLAPDPEDDFLPVPDELVGLVADSEYDPAVVPASDHEIPF